LENKRLAQMEFNRTTEVLKQTVIRSPVSGIVVERFMSSGEFVDDQPILKIAQVDPLNVEVILPVQIFGIVNVDMPATVKPEKPVGGVYTANIKIVDKFIDAASGTFRVRLELSNPEYRLPPGLKCKVIFKSAQLKKVKKAKKG